MRRQLHRGGWFRFKKTCNGVFLFFFFPSLKCEILTAEVGTAVSSCSVLATPFTDTLFFCGLDMLRQLFKNEEEKIPVARSCFVVTSAPCAEPDLWTGSYYCVLLLQPFFKPFERRG